MRKKNFWESGGEKSFYEKYLDAKLHFILLGKKNFFT